MKIKFILLILLIVAGCDLLVGSVTGRLIKGVPDAGLNQTNTAQALFKEKTDVLILGSSRANHSFDSRIITDSTGMSCYNAGRDGMGIAYDACVLKAYLERRQPKVVVLDITESMIDGSWDGTLKDMNCYYGLSDAVDSVINAWATPIRRWQLKSSLYRYNKTFEWLLKAYHSSDESALMGYRPMPVNTDTHFEAIIQDAPTFQPSKHSWETLNDMVQWCQSRHIRLILTNSPSLTVAPHGGLTDWLQQYAVAHHIPFYDYTRDATYYRHPEYFYDYGHLNEQGAAVFTKNFCKVLVAK